MKFTKPDGVIEFGFSGCCCPPGQRRPGQHTNATTRWWRVNEGAWQPVRRQSHTRTLAEAAETCAEFQQALEETP